MPSAEARLDTPLMRQYGALKAAYPHAILFFRLGDFYELFADDAKLAAGVLGVTLTARQGISMCGVPAHSCSPYIAKLLKAGHKVAIADQMEDPSQAKGIVRREVTRLITPGTVVEDELLDAVTANYLVAVELDLVGWGLACMEVSTGEFWATQALNDAGCRQLYGLLAKLDPAELLISAKAKDVADLRASLSAKTSVSLYDAPKSAAPAPWAQEGPWRNHSLAARAASTAAAYINDTQSQLAAALTPAYREPHGDMQLDETAIRTLELVSSSTGSRKLSLWGVLDRCRTSMGSRRLRSWILHPSTDVLEIERRQNAVEELLDKAGARSELAEVLGEIADVERLLSRLATRAGSPRDIAGLRDSLAQLPTLKAWLADTEFCSGLKTLSEALHDAATPLEEVRNLLGRAVTDKPPARVSDGGIIRDGFDAKLDELRALKGDSQKFLSELETQERAASGINSLKVGYNSVFGYYIEITRAHVAKAPARYTRKQTLANGERYITPELKELESKILGAEDHILKLEAKLFEKVRGDVLERRAALARFAALIAELDVFNALAEAAALNDFVKPKVDLSHRLVIEDGRHPVVETTIPGGSFVPNSISLDGTDPQVLILTGPNMGGKSTYLRQNALIAVMAQIGSFVPAKSATVGIVDKVLTRIGAQDALARGESTFMVEMNETARILKSATPRSLLILDEVGRGTSTFDGISIAWAVLEHLNKAYREDKGPRGPRVLFATHYFELTKLAELLSGVANANVEAREWTNAEGHTDVVFLHKISPGPADRSFGIHVARLAGLPEGCLRRAREILATLENESKAKKSEPELPLFDEHPVLHAIRLLDVNEVTPVQALQRIAEWKKEI
ncbi:MAG: DNA mismatch repair protein MutS [Elusimicrobia bacterium]|nr:DNA mismatch repair protein MutS [Elusimicrobiota bacterium]